MYLSLSSSYTSNACAIRQSIINYTHASNKTQFFDWLVVNMKSVNQVLENTPIMCNQLYIDVSDNFIKFKNFDLLISYHDVKNFDLLFSYNGVRKINMNILNEITEKYNKRYKRLINTIKEENKINFIRYCKNQQNLEETEIIRFYKNIIKINPNLIFNFILISDCDNLVIPTELLKDNFIYINLNNYINDDILNELDSYLKIIKTYKCIFNLIK
jgi:hypothetical protein